MIRIQNGRVLDPSRSLDHTGDIVVDGGKIVEEAVWNPVGAEAIDASGCWVTPGLVDFHCHFYHGGSEIGMPVDAACLPCGVTTAVDAGSMGHIGFAAFYREVLARSLVRTRALVNLSPAGLLSLRFHENLDPELFDPELLRQLREDYPGAIVGLKMRLSRDVLGELGIAPLTRMMELAEALSLPVVVHTTDPVCPVEEILDHLRGGDVFTHCFHGAGDTILQDGKVKPAVWAARERGVLFDDCHGRSHFSFPVLEAALAEGFPPDIISSDAIAQSIYRQPLVGLPMVLSRYLAVGMPVLDLLRACTSRPSRFLGLEATLRPGCAADIAVLQPLERETTHTDAHDETRIGSMRLVPKVTILGGRIVYRSFDTF